MLKAAILALVLAVTAPAPAVAKTYSGNEVEALLCAYLLSFASTLAVREGIIDASEKRLADVIAYAILVKYVSGTAEQKIKAMRVLGERRTLFQTLDDFRARSKTCARRFPL